MRNISRLLILCLLLLGCAKEEAIEPVFIPAETVAVQGLYDTGSNLEISSSGALKVFPISPRGGKGLLPFADGILMFSSGERTTLTLLTGDTLIPTAQKNLDFSLEPEACSIHDRTLSYYDTEKKQTVILDTSLEVVRTIPAPAGLAGTPRLSDDGSVMYYSTSTTVRAWDLETNIHRILRQTGQPLKDITGFYCDGAVLHCGTAFLSSETGALLAQEDSPLILAAPGEDYIAASWETNLWSLIFTSEGQIKALTPRALSAEYFLLAESMSVVTANQTGDVVTLDHYDLASGMRTASQMVRGSQLLSVIPQDGGLYLLMYLPEYEGQAILYWDLSRTPTADQHIYTGPHFTASNPDREGLQNCQAYADQIGQRYGLKILLWRQGADLVSGEVTAKPEHRVNILMRELELLDHRLSQFPDGLLQTTAADFGSLNIGLAAQINGSIQESSHQFFSGQTANILLAVGDDSESALYHELFHVMQTHILSHSSAFDKWNSLNPQGFQYDYDYAANAIRNSGIYLTESNRYFVDTFSMSYPKEDQARVFEYAMMPGNSHLFKSDAMKKKLWALCSGIRAAYRLPDGSSYLWEQYLG